jgi:hypothetical protein
MFLQSSSVVVFLFPPLLSFLTFHSEQRFTPDVSARRRVRKPVIFFPRFQTTQEGDCRRSYQPDGGFRIGQRYAALKYAALSWASR